MASLCKKRSFCRVPNCSIKQNNLLHQTHVTNNRIRSDMSNNLRICMPIVCIHVNGTHEVYALLDTGSTSTFVTNDLVSRLSLPTSFTNLNLKSMNIYINKRVDLVDITIESLDNEFCSDMKNICVTDCILTTSYAMDVNMYHHLSGLDLVNPFHATVDVLIGQDYASCFLPLEVCKGIRDEPFAVRTPLGYVIHGHKSTHIVGHSVVSNFVSKICVSGFMV